MCVCVCVFKALALFSIKLVFSCNLLIYIFFLHEYKHDNSPDGRFILTASNEDGTARIWKSRTNMPGHVLLNTTYADVVNQCGTEELKSASRLRTQPKVKIDMATWCYGGGCIATAHSCKPYSTRKETWMMPIRV